VTVALLPAATCACSHAASTWAFLSSAVSLRSSRIISVCGLTFAIGAVVFSVPRVS
jgi:hypothetical protein